MLVLATHNSDKLAELRVLLAYPGVKLIVPDRLPDVEEDEATYLENATKKAVAAVRHTGFPAVADDTGLEVDALGGAPGVLAARFAGPKASYADNCALLLKKLAGVPEEQRGATFRCVMVVAGPHGRWTHTEGEIRGLIAEAPRGKTGFGYDPVFYLPGLGKTLAELSIAEKNRLSHRARAAAALRPWLAAWAVTGQLEIHESGRRAF